MGSWPVGHLQGVEELNSRPPKTSPSSGREEDLNPGPPDYMSSAIPLGHARLPNNRVLFEQKYFFRINSIRKKKKTPSFNDSIDNSSIYMGLKAKWLHSKKAFNMDFWSATFFLIIIKRKKRCYPHVQLPEIVCGTDISTVVMDYDNIDRHLIKMK